MRGVGEPNEHGRLPGPMTLAVIQTERPPT